MEPFSERGLAMTDNAKCDSNRRFFGFCVSVSLMTSTPILCFAQNDGDQAIRNGTVIRDGYYNIGDFHYAVSSDSKDAQVWFDRGLAMCIAFNHEEAVRCFEQALKNDPDNAMAYWGLGYAWGPNINNTEIEPHQIAEANLAIRLAKIHAQHATDLERKLIYAMAERYTTPVPEDRTPLNNSYADAMRDVHRGYSEDPLVSALFAESLMILRPWNQWDKSGEPAKETPEIMAVLNDGLERNPSFPALCHLYIHAVEASQNPERAMPAANRLRDSMPGAGHLVHMPSHIDVLVGDYQKVIEMNRQAIAVDREFVKRQGANNFYTFYRIHNYHFLVYGAMFDGQSKLALKAARDLQSQVPDSLLREQTDFLDAFMEMPLHVMIRFGMWDEILKEPKPDDYLPTSQALYHYARAIAFSATNRIPMAENERGRFVAATKRVPESSVLFNNSSRSILAVAKKMMDGEIAYRSGKPEVAFDLLREAVLLDDAMNYDEPWGWMQPVRHALGALLLESGEIVEAEAVYREDLKRHPNNLWSLSGLSESLRRQGKTDDAIKTGDLFRVAAKRADVPVDRSCFCRQAVVDDQR